MGEQYTLYQEIKALKTINSIITLQQITVPQYTLNIAL